VKGGGEQGKRKKKGGLFPVKAGKEGFICSSVSGNQKRRRTEEVR